MPLSMVVSRTSMGTTNFGQRQKISGRGGHIVMPGDQDDVYGTVSFNPVRQPAMQIGGELYPVRVLIDAR